MGKPKNLYHFLVVGKGGNEQHYEQYQIPPGQSIAQSLTSEVPVEPLGLTSSSSPEDNFYCEIVGQSQRDQAWLISFAPRLFPKRPNR